MAKINIPCLVARQNKGGVTSWYWQPSKTLAVARWTPKPLGKDPGAAFRAAELRNAAVAAWRLGGPHPDLDARGKTGPAHRRLGTVAALVARYRKEHVQGKKPDGRPLLRAKTAEAYETGLKRIDLWAGQQPLAYVTPARVRALRDATARPVESGGIGHSAAYALLKTLRQLFAFAESVDLIPKGSNPATDFKLSPPPPRATVWELDDDAAFDAAARDKGLPGLALAREIALYSAQREGDQIKFTEGQLTELQVIDPVVRRAFAPDGSPVMGWQLDQTKTSTDYSRRMLSIPFDQKLLAKVQAALRTNRARDRAADPPRLLSHVLVDDRAGPNHGLPWKKRDFIKAFRLVLDHAATATGRDHMRELTWHDLRRTRVVRLLRRNFDKTMIGAITGLDPKTIDAMLKIYGPIDPNMTAAALAADQQQEHRA